MLPTMQSARPELADFKPPPSLQNGKQVEHRTPVSMSVHAGRPASTGSDLKPPSNADSPINNARFCRRTGAPEMMSRPTENPSPRQVADSKNADVLRVLATAKKAMTPSQIAWAVSKSGRGWCIRQHPDFAQGVADTSLIGAVLRRIKAVKVERGLWLKPGAKVKDGS